MSLKPEDATTTRELLKHDYISQAAQALTAFGLAMADFQRKKREYRQQRAN